MQRNQIQLLGNRLKNQGFDFSQNKRFFNALYNSTQLNNISKWFDRLDCSISWQRQLNKNMTLENFLGLMKKETDILLKLGSPHETQIQYCAMLDLKKYTEFAWIECDYQEDNYKVISELFQDCYGCDLDSVPVADYLKIYHRNMGLS